MPFTAGSMWSPTWRVTWGPVPMLVRTALLVTAGTSTRRLCEILCGSMLRPQHLTSGKVRVTGKARGRRILEGQGESVQRTHGEGYRPARLFVCSKGSQQMLTGHRSPRVWPRNSPLLPGGVCVCETDTQVDVAKTVIVAQTSRFLDQPAGCSSFASCLLQWGFRQVA